MARTSPLVGNATRTVPAPDPGGVVPPPVAPVTPGGPAIFALSRSVQRPPAIVFENGTFIIVP